MPWEVIVVDNGSTDDTPGVARRCWPQQSRARLRVVSEPRVGVMYARMRGIEEAKYELITFADDDNWLALDFISRAASIMMKHREVAVLGGSNHAECEGTAPPWLDFNGSWYALTPESDPFGDVTERPGVLPSAGMTLRRSAWLELRQTGFEFATMGRQGPVLSGLMDMELCLALRLAGWKIWRDPGLRLRHFLPQHRLQWKYLRRLVRGAGKSAPLLDPYLFALESIRDGASRSGTLAWFSQNWIASALKKMRKLAGRPVTLISSRLLAMEGDHRVIRTELHIGELTKLLQMRAEYDRGVKRLREGRLRNALDQLRLKKKACQ